MLNVYIILANDSGFIRHEALRQPVQPGYVYWLLDRDTALTVSAQCQCYVFSSLELQTIYRDIRHLIRTPAQSYTRLPKVHAVAVDAGMQRAISQMAGLSKTAMLHFLCMYCLLADKGQWAGLLQRAIAADGDMFEFIHQHRLESWPVQRYADEMGLSLRKFNQLFREKFGQSAKQWLTVQRLEHAHHLLQSTDKKVIDVAVECGFCNHAHFSDSFRRHFQMSPSAVRRQSVLPRLAATVPMGCAA
ncbi:MULTISPECIES: helix-turn-helix domain-containing protein [unclassified Paludibacterium]|uniref:helix-turn-helix domain-containing protein n=1 Tax=unclassified Paludibacterium TaxID=2618429 RepID=UPI001C04F0E0|nr:AraC family transcriptional regulator [Paludibacterium sp. B53371]BEV73182.1 hypothetical protein THUN1379_26640 [Paludibacterium sp. THUN1379]